MKLTLNTAEELEEIINSGDIRISQALVSTILKNLKGRKRHIPAFSVFLEEEDNIFDITVDRNEFVNILNTHLPVLEKNELFEECAQVVKAIEEIKNKKS